MKSKSIGKVIGERYRLEQDNLKRIITSPLTSDHEIIAIKAKIDTLLWATLTAYEMEGKK